MDASLVVVLSCKIQDYQQLVGGEDRDQAAFTQSRAGLPIEERVVTVVRVVNLGPFVRATAAGADEDVPPLLDGVVVTVEVPWVPADADDLDLRVDRRFAARARSADAV